MIKYNNKLRLAWLSLMYYYKHPSYLIHTITVSFTNHHKNRFRFELSQRVGDFLYGADVENDRKEMGYDDGDDVYQTRAGARFARYQIAQ